MTVLQYDVKLGQAAALRGHRQGLAQPCLHVLCHLALVPEGTATPDLPAADAALLVPMPPGQALSLSASLVRTAGALALAKEVMPWLEALNSLLVRLQVSAGWPVCQGGVVEQLGRPKERPGSVSAVIAFPSLNPAVLLKGLPWVFAVLAEPCRREAQSAQMPTAASVLAMLEAVSPGGTNTRTLLQAAYSRNVPVKRLAGSALQYGWGSRSRWMESSFTDADSVISARLARDKSAAHALMQSAGLPVPLQVVVSSLEQACKAAASLGYPVVIKPADLDGGKGVEAGLQDEASLRAAYPRSRQHSQNLILEQHVEGKDYRLGVLNGRLGWVTYREPAGVWGDGVRSVFDLVAAANLDPRRGTRRWSHMAPIVLNAEADELLQQQGLALGDVPPPASFVQLRRAANVSLGGRPVSIPFEAVHPDNAALALQVARLFRLQLAGVDLITPDIARSWREAGGAVCEVNGQPQFSVTRPDFPEQVLAELVQGDGRVPVLVLLAEGGWGGWTQALHTQLNQAGLNAGFVLADGLFRGADKLATKRRSAFDDVQTLLLDNTLDAVVVATNGMEWLPTGMPVDRVDLVVADGTQNQRVLQMLADAAGEVWQAALPLSADGPPEAEWTARLGSFIMAKHAAHTAKEAS
jgi:cyanophycin synthetase